MNDLIEVSQWIAGAAVRVAGASSAGLRIEANPGGRHHVVPDGQTHTIASFTRGPDAVFFTDAALDLRSALDCLAALADEHRPQTEPARHPETHCRACSAAWPCPTARTLVRHLADRAAAVNDGQERPR